MTKVIDILDSTLRDGAQGEGISFTVEDKLNIVRTLDSFGIKYIEAGNPGSNPKDQEFFSRVSGMKFNNAKLVAFGSTRRKNISAAEDSNVKAIESASTPVVCIFGKSWNLHVTEIINTTYEENLNMITDTVAYFKSLGKEVIYDAEHFFDGYKSSNEYALETLAAAVRGGADCIVLCDTNGGAFPSEIIDITKTVCSKFNVKVGIHCHNDSGLAVANTVLSVEAGASHVQGTFLGFGERCGNTNLSTLIPNLQLKRGYRIIPDESLATLTQTSRYLAEIANIAINNNEPYIGNSAFAHKAGMHADGVIKNSISFEHIDPELVGNVRRFLMSEITGRNALLRKVAKICPQIGKDSPEAAAILKVLKDMEFKGYQYEGAESSFDILIRKHLGMY